MEVRIILTGVSLILLIILFKDLIKMWRQHRSIYQNGNRYTGKIIGYKRAPCSILTGGGVFPETPVVEFLYDGKKQTYQLLKNYFGQPNKMYTDICVCYWPRLPELLIADDQYYWTRYIFNLVFVFAEIFAAIFFIFIY